MILHLIFLSSFFSIITLGQMKRFSNNLNDALMNDLSNASLIQNKVIAKDYNVLKRIFMETLLRHPTKDFCIHFDTVTSNFVNIILDKKSFKIPKKKYSSFITLNYDSLKHRNSPLKHLNRFPTIHLIFLAKPSEFDDMNYDILKSSDIIIFVCHKSFGACKDSFKEGNNVLDPYFIFGHKHFSSVLYTLVLECSENHIRLYESSLYCGDSAKILSSRFEMSLQFNSDLTSSISSLKNTVRNLLNENKFNFNNHTFDLILPVGGINFSCFKPNVSIVKDDYEVVTCENTISAEGNILEEMKKVLNFKTNFLSFDKKYGTSRESLIRLVNQSKADWLVGSITITAKRWETIDFSVSILEDRCKVLYTEHEHFFKDGLKLINVFSMGTWFFIGLILLVQSIALFFWNQRNYFTKYTSLSEITWAVGFLLVDQAQPGTLRAVRGRVIFFWLLLSSNSISSLYKAQLSSIVTKPPINDLQTFDQLVKEGYKLNLVDATFITGVLNDSTDNSFKELSKRVKFNKVLCKTMHEFIGKNEMIIEETDLLYFSLKYKCKNTLSYNDMRRILISPDNIFPSNHGWAFRKGAPYLPFINKYILRFHETGHILKWSESIMTAPKNISINVERSSAQTNNSEQNATLNQFYGQFVLLSIGLLLSFLCFCLEIACYLYNRWIKSEMFNVS